MPDGKSRIVVVDSIAEGVATLIPDGEAESFVAELAELPPDTREGDCVRQEFASGTSSFRPAPAEAERRRKKVRGKLDRLRGR